MTTTLINMKLHKELKMAECVVIGKQSNINKSFINLILQQFALQYKYFNELHCSLIIYSYISCC